MRALDQRVIDNTAPFRDVRGESDADVAARAAGIDQSVLRAWFERYRKYTYPATYGHSECDRLFHHCWQMWGDGGQS